MIFDWWGVLHNVLAILDKSQVASLEKAAATDLVKKRRKKKQRQRYQQRCHYQVTSSIPELYRRVRGCKPKIIEYLLCCNNATRTKG